MRRQPDFAQGRNGGSEARSEERRVKHGYEVGTGASTQTRSGDSGGEAGNLRVIQTDAD